MQRKYLDSNKNTTVTKIFSSVYVMHNVHKVLGCLYLQCIDIHLAITFSPNQQGNINRLLLIKRAEYSIIKVLPLRSLSIKQNQEVFSAKLQEAGTPCMNVFLEIAIKNLQVPFGIMIYLF